MRRTLLVACLLWAAAPGAAPCQTAPDAAELRALLAEFLAGASRNDAAVHDRFWAESLVYTRSTGRRIGKAEIMRDVRSAPPPGPGVSHTSYSAEDVAVQQFGDTAVVTFRLKGVAEHAGGTELSEYLNTGTFVKHDGRWQAVAWQATRVPLADDEARRQAAAADSALHGALLAADVKTLDPLLDDGFVWVHSDGHRLTRSQLIEQLRSGALHYAKLDTSDVTVSMHGSTAVVRGASSRQRSAIPESPGTGDPAPRAFFYTLTLVEDGGAWKAVAMHTSRP